ncbi:MAG TPA: SDR family oxidoreductase [Blastocatellia bacterium]|nr:SDR family oxidoreductase [Blastocatellia bacterium]
MDLGLKGRVAIVAAASSGLGKASALELANEGASLVISARNEARLNAAAEEICGSTGVEVLAVPSDVTSSDDVQQLVSAAISRFGRVDILVANAGGPPAGFFDDFALQDYRDAIELNLLSTVNLCKAVVDHMRERHWGRIVAITSIAVKQPVENLILSNTARAGLAGFLKTLSQQVASYAITVNTVCPGYHLTDRLKQVGSHLAKKDGVAVEEIYSRWASDNPMRRIGEPRELSALVAFLCSERASYITGTVTQVDGGAYRGLL